MHWTSKSGLILLFTLFFSVFIPDGWYSPKSAHAVVINTTNFNAGGDASPFSGLVEGYWTFSATSGSWNYDQNNTTSSNVGACGPHEGNAYAYTEASSSAGPDFYAESQVMDLNANVYTIDFWWDKHHNGTGNCSLAVELSTDGGGTWPTTLFSTQQDDGAAASGCSLPWSGNQVIDLTAYSGNNAKVRFHVNTGGSWQCDVALDLIVTDQSSRCVDPDPSAISVAAGQTFSGDPYNVGTSYSIDSGDVGSIQYKVTTGSGGGGTPTVYYLHGDCSGGSPVYVFPDAPTTNAAYLCDGRGRVRNGSASGTVDIWAEHVIPTSVVGGMTVTGSTNAADNLVSWDGDNGASDRVQYELCEGDSSGTVISCFDTTGLQNATTGGSVVDQQLSFAGTPGTIAVGNTLVIRVTIDDQSRAAYYAYGWDSGRGPAYYGSQVTLSIGPGETICTDWTSNASIPASGTPCDPYVQTAGNYNLYVRGTDPDCSDLVEATPFPQTFTWNSCTDPDPPVVTINPPLDNATVGGSVLIRATVTNENGTMTGMTYTTVGSACDGTAVAMTEQSPGVWEANWNTSLCGDPTPETGITIDVSGTEPDCGAVANATQITNITVDNTCTDGDPATSVTITPASGSTVGGTVTVQAAIGGETTPGAIGASATTTVTGSVSCDVTNQAMAWNATSSVWEYAWNTSACGLATPDTGVTIQVTYTDPDCSGKTVINNSSTAITIDNADPSKLTSCGACHRFGATFADGSARNVPAGTFPGSHGLHANTYAFVCSKCHIVPATETSADFAHRNGSIQMAVPINGDTGATYGKGSSWPQTNTPSAFSQCNNTYCHSNGTSVISGSIAVNSSPTWGSSSNCGSCHGTLADDGRPNYVNGTPKRNTHGDGASYGVTHKATACPTCHVGVSGSAGAYSMDPATHVNGSYDLQPSLGYVQSTGTCQTPGCHGTAVWGTSLGCVDCHSSPQTGTHGTPRDAVVSEFGLAWGHKKSGRSPVTNADCIVCHLEGVYATQAKSAVHGDGNIDLRDPDGAGETAITDISGAAFTFTKFATSYAAGSRTTTGHLSNSVDNVLTQKFCMACHDADGASNPTARTTGGTAFMPWGGVNLGANYTVANGAASPGGLIDVFDQFAPTNSSVHPVRGPRNKGYPTPARYAVPYNNFTRSAGTLANGVVLNCFDCHNSPSPLTNRTVAAHGSSAANYMRGVVTVSGTPASGSNEATLCTTCHAGYNTATTNGSHEAGSAATNLNRSEKNPFMRYGCNMCHSSGYATPTVRPVRAMDVHGVNVLPSTGQTLTGGWASYGKPYAFIRNRSFLGDHQPARIGGTNYTPQCNMAGNNGDGNSICRNKGTKSYSVGGVY